MPIFASGTVVLARENRERAQFCSHSFMGHRLELSSSLAVRSSTAP